MWNMKKILLIILIFSISSFAQQDNTRKVYKILGISVEGNVLSDANTILFNSGLKVGQDIEIPGEQTVNAIKNLWNLGIFNDIQILSSKLS